VIKIVSIFAPVVVN